MIILGIDPSLKCTGLVLVEFTRLAPRVLEHAVFRLETAVGVDEVWIAEQVLRVMRPWLPRVMWVGLEVPIAKAGVGNTLFRQGQMIGSLRTQMGLERGKIVPVYPMQAKAAIGVYPSPGSRKKGAKPPKYQGKEAVVHAVGESFGSDWFPLRKDEREAVCDACAVAAATHLLAGE